MSARAVLEAAHRIAGDIGAKVDDREGLNPGAKFFHWERRGIPVVLELGPRDLASGNIVMKRRDTGTKEVLPQEGMARACYVETLEVMQTDMLAARRGGAIESEYGAGEFAGRRWKTFCAK